MGKLLQIIRFRRQPAKCPPHTPETLRTLAHGWVDMMEPTEVNMEGGHDKPVVLTIVGKERLR